MQPPGVLVPSIPDDLRALLRELDTAGKRAGGLIAAAGALPSGTTDNVRLTIAIERAARLLEPKVQTVALERSTLRDAPEVEAWVERQKKRLIEAVSHGPVLVS